MNVSDIKDLQMLLIRQQSRSQNIAAPEKPAGSAAVKQGETVDLSTMARDIQQAKVAVSGLPDVREDKVQAIKAQVEKGTYNVSGEQIAQNMVEESILNLFS